jgi:RNA polymerase sigma-70 factor (ECF subfamily)
VSLDLHIEQHGELPARHDAASAPDRALDRKQLAAHLRRALESLPFDQRTVIVLREVDGLSYDEIAFSLGVTLGTVKARLTRARQALRACLHEVHAP